MTFREMSTRELVLYLATRVRGSEPALEAELATRQITRVGSAGLSDEEWLRRIGFDVGTRDDALVETLRKALDMALDRRNAR